MINEVKVFNFEEMNIRTVDIDNDVWFVASDVAAVLGLTNVSVSLKSLDEDERSKFNLGRQGFVNVISEPGLYRFIGASRKPEAKRFMRWVTHEVLPSIRKTGAYQAQPNVPMDPMSQIQLLASSTYQAIDDVKSDITELKEKFGLPTALRRRFTKTRNRKVMDVMGGYHGTAYQNRKVRSAVYRALERYIKDRYEIESYDDLPISRFDEAVSAVQRWEPDEILSFAIKGASETLDFEEAGM